MLAQDQASKKWGIPGFNHSTLTHEVQTMWFKFRAVGASAEGPGRVPEEDLTLARFHFLLSCGLPTIFVLLIFMSFVYFKIYINCF